MISGRETDLTELLQYIDPALCNYQDWMNVGMALKDEGYDVSVWEQWSARDAARYHPGECERKWRTFNGSGTPVTGGTIVQMAKDSGWRTERESRELNWDDEIGGAGDLVVVDKNWIQGQDIHIPEHWHPERQLITYLETLFESSENVGYVTQSWEKDGRYLPSKGAWDRTAGELIHELSKCGGDIGKVLGDYNEAAGAWIRFNPLDGNGVKDDNVTDYRYALIESDTLEIERQNAIIREMELPVACLVYSGKKSLHAIVHIDAADYTEYRKRVDYLYEVCRKNGLKIDSQNRNPSRLSRMPGVVRGGNKQYLLDTNIGKASWTEWKEWIESATDDLPDPENLTDIWGNLPELSPPLIANVLRQGHKMLLAGPSKAGKSYELIELCCAIAEGREWLGFPCTQGRILYVNLELDRASCLHRFKDVYTALGWQADHLQNIDIWNLRGKSVPMDKLSPKLIRRAAKKGYIAIVIDPIYKVITGDENSAEQMSHFCNQFDKVCTELGCAVIYCHHHSKGGQGDKRSMDRASGSGVFARDPDALLDMIELEVPESVRAQNENNATCAIGLKWLKRFRSDWDSLASQDDRCSASAMLEVCRKALAPASYGLMMKEIETERVRQQSKTAWRVEGTLREFPKFPPINMWFEYPVHRVDNSEILKDLASDINSKGSPWRKNFSGKKSTKERAKERSESLETAFDACNMDGNVAVADLAEYMGKSEKTVRRMLKESEKFWVDEGKTGKK